MSNRPGDKGGLADDFDSLYDLPTDAIEPLTDEVPRVAGVGGYDGFYDPPDPGPSEPDLGDIPAELRNAPPPLDYGQYYDPPGED